MNTYYPEMNETKPADSQIDASLSHYGDHWFLTTTLKLSGRGVRKLGTDMNGVNRYKVTELAYQRICGQYSVSCALSL